MIVNDVNTYIDLIILYILDFYVCLGIDWLSHYHAVIDYFAKTNTLAMIGVLTFVWQGVAIHKTIRIISYV